MDRLASPLLLLFASLGADAAPVVDRPDRQRHFDARQVRGTFVLFEPLPGRYQVLDERRAKQRFLPASTFKIANAVIGLEVGSIADGHEVFRWDGKPQWRPELERDHVLATGMRDSVVWMFQEVARRTGKARMCEWLDRLDHGNRDIGGGIDQFWLRGSLRVSAWEQAGFLYRLDRNRQGCDPLVGGLGREAGPPRGGVRDEPHHRRGHALRRSLRHRARHPARGGRAA